MASDKVRKPRPYWHVDAKWITGILLLFLLTLTILIFILVQLTAPKQGIALLTTMLASSFSYESGGLDTPDDVNIMREKIAQSPNGEWQPIPGMQIVVRAEDIAGKTPREARLWFFRQWAEPLYYDGAEGLANLMTDPDMQKSVEEGVGPLGFMNAGTHSKLKIAFAISGAVSLLFLGLLAIFSYRFGRLGSPGCVIFLTAIPGLVFMLGLRGWIEQTAQNPTGGGEETFITRYAQLAADVLPDVVRQAIQTYTILIFLGLGLMFLALIGAIFIRERPGKAPASVKTETDLPQ